MIAWHVMYFDALPNELAPAQMRVTVVHAQTAIYHLSKQAELCIAGNYMKLTDQGVIAATNGFKNQKERVVGVRFKTY